MSLLGPNSCLAPSSASILRIPYTFGATSLFVCLNEHLQRRMSEHPCWTIAFLDTSKNNSHERIGAKLLPAAIKCIDLNNTLLELQAQY